MGDQLRREQARTLQQQKQQEEEEQARAADRAAIKRKLEEIEQKRLTAAATLVQARFRGLKARVLKKEGLFAAVVELKMAKEKENELRKEQARVLDEQRKRDE